MKSQSNVQPETIWVRYIDENNNVVVRLRDNIISTIQEDESILYQYDEIEIEVPNRDNLIEYLNNNINVYFNKYLEDLKTDKINELNNKCSDEIEKGMLCTTNNHFYRFNKDEDQSNFAAQFLEIIDGTASDIINWKTEDAGIISITQDEFKSIYRELGNNQKNLIAKYWGYKMQILNSITIEDVLNVVWV